MATLAQMPPSLTHGSNNPVLKVIQKTAPSRKILAHLEVAAITKSPQSRSHPFILKPNVP